MWYGYDSHVDCYWKVKSKEAQELAKDLRITVSEEKSWYGEDYTQWGTDWRAVAKLIERVRDRP